jgi:hypothetical protein
VRKQTLPDILDTTKSCPVQGVASSQLHTSAESVEVCVSAPSREREEDETEGKAESEKEQMRQLHNQRFRWDEARPA